MMPHAFAARPARPAMRHSSTRPVLYDGGLYTQEPHQLDDLRRDRSLSLTARLAAIAINRLTIGWQRAEAALSIAEIADEAGLGRTATVAALHELEARDYLIVTRQPGYPSLYRMWYARVPLHSLPPGEPPADYPPQPQSDRPGSRTVTIPTYESQRHEQKGDRDATCEVGDADQIAAVTEMGDTTAVAMQPAWPEEPLDRPTAGVGHRAHKLAFWPLARTAEERLALTEPVDGTMLRTTDDGWWCYEARYGLWRCFHVGSTLPADVHRAPPVQPNEDDARLTSVARLALVEGLHHRARPVARRS